MKDIAEIPMTLVLLHWQWPLTGHVRAQQLRGALADAFPDEPMFHQHEGESVIYRYPRVHYRWHQGCGVVVGFQEGAERLRELPWLDLELRLGAVQGVVSDVEIRCDVARFGVAKPLQRYGFQSPWIPLNQENYLNYQTMSDVEQMAERDRLLVAQILSALRGFHIDFPEHLYAAFEIQKSLLVRYKDQTLTGFKGVIITNADLPDHFAIGRAVSHGYGWLRKF